MSVTQQTLNAIVLPVKKQLTDNTPTTTVNPGGYRTVTKFGENGHGIFNPNQKYTTMSPYVPTGFF